VPELGLYLVVIDLCCFGVLPVLGVMPVVAVLLGGVGCWIFRPGSGGF
jgi:hypothetical protein